MTSDNTQLSIFSKAEAKGLGMRKERQPEPKKQADLHRIECERCKQKKDPVEVPFWSVYCISCWRPAEMPDAWRQFWLHQFGALARPAEEYQKQWCFGMAPSHYQKARKQARLLKEALESNYLDVMPTALKALGQLSTYGQDKPLMAGWKAYLIARIKEQTERDLNQTKLNLEVRNDKTNSTQTNKPGGKGS